MPQLVTAYGKPVTVTYGASGTLRQQIQGGAPVDLVVFASPDPVDALIRNGFARANTQRRLATNELVLIAPVDSDTTASWSTLSTLPHDERVAIGDPRAVPAGRYAKDAMVTLGVWENLQDRIVFAGNVAAVLAYARRGEVAAAIVYSTDVLGLKDVQTVDRATWADAPQPEVIGAMISTSQDAQAFFDYIASPDGEAVLMQFGFGPA